MSYAAEMKMLLNTVDLWVFTRSADEVQYLLLQASREKADRFFGGNAFWQIPGTFITNEDEATSDTLRRTLAEFGLSATSVWAVEHVSTIYNRRFDAIQIIPSFAAELADEVTPILDSFEFGAHAWLGADEVSVRLTFQALHDSFAQLRNFITEVEAPLGEFRII